LSSLDSPRSDVERTPDAEPEPLELAHDSEPEPFENEKQVLEPLEILKEEVPLKKGKKMKKKGSRTTAVFPKLEPEPEPQRVFEAKFGY
jgi:hypothetical protein